MQQSSQSSAANTAREQVPDQTPVRAVVVLRWSGGSATSIHAIYVQQTPGEAVFEANKHGLGAVDAACDAYTWW